MKRVRAEILNSRKLGAYHSLTLVAPEIAERARPGQFVSVAMPEDRRSLLRRHFSIHQASRRGGWAGTLEFVFDPRGPGTSWLAETKAHQFVDVIGPLGRPFAPPAKLTNCLLIAEGRGAAPIYFLAQELRSVGKRVDMLLGAETEEHVFKPIEGKRLSQTIEIVTLDGSMGAEGAVADRLAEVTQASRAEVIYAAARRSTLRTIAAFCVERRVPAQVVVEEPMACGLGQCFSCVVPIVRKDGSGYDNLRACTDGPVFNAARIFWDRWLDDTRTALPTPPGGFPEARAWQA